VLRRFGPQALVVFLVLSTGIAFAVTERLKLEKNPIAKTQVTKVFSPTCGCSTSRASISFWLRRSGKVTVSVLDSDDHVIRTLLENGYEPIGRLRVTWNGRDDFGLVAPDGNYRVRVRLPAERRTTTLPNVIQLDTSPPTITLLGIVPRTISPDLDGRADAAHVSFKQSKGSWALLYVDGRFVTKAKLSSRKIDWHGLNRQGRMRLGLHRLTLRALDRAGNLSAPTAPVEVDVRILRLRPARISVPVGASFSVAISTDRRRVRWRFAGATGITRRKRLFLRAPAVPGRYWLLVHSGSYRAGALITVT
jgi:hypothetical protein